MTSAAARICAAWQARRDGPVIRGEGSNNIDQAVIEPQVFRRASPGNHQGVVVFRLDLNRIGIQCKIPGFSVKVWSPSKSWIALLIFSPAFCLAHGVRDMPDHRQRLKRDHHLIVFREIADEKENLLGCIIVS
jgi:hypothetical protein